MAEKTVTPGKGWHPALTRKCKPNCMCGKHTRTRMHNMLIGQSVARTAARKRAEKASAR